MPAVTAPPLLRATPRDLIAKTFAFEDLPTEGGRVEMWEKPDTKAQYVLGADFALGIPGKDWDTICILKRTRQPPYPQVFEAQGNWGPDFDRLLYAAATFYCGAFVVGEANTGTYILSRLYHEYGYYFMFGDRDETVKGRRTLRRLGCWKGHHSITLPKFRRAVNAGEVLVRSKSLLDQMRKLQFKAKSSIEPGAAMDENLQVKLAGGGSPDLIISASLAFHGIEEVGYFEEPTPKFAPGTLGDILGHNTTFEPERKGQSFIPEREIRRKSVDRL